MARQVIVQPQSDLDIQADALRYEDQQSGLAYVSSTNLIWFFDESRRIRCNFHGWSATPGGRFCDASRTGYTFSPNHKT
jgi:hypothetical protein